MSLSPDSVQALVAVASFLGSLAAAVVLGIWRLSKWAARLAAGQAAALSALKAVDDQVEALGAEVQELVAAHRETRIHLGVREREITRIEGKLEAGTAEAHRLNASVTEVLASIKALWSTLQTLHPDKVPRRASDRG